MNYLARLKQLNAGEIFQCTPNVEPTEPTEPPFDGFVGSGRGHIKNISLVTSTTLDGEKGRTVATVATVANPKAETVDPEIPPSVIKESDELLHRLTGQHQKVREMLAADSSVKYAVVSDDEAEADFVILTVGIQGQAIADLRIPRAKYDGMLILAMIEKHTAQADDLKGVP